MADKVIVNIYPYHVDITLPDGGYQSPDYDEVHVHLGDDPSCGSVPLADLIQAYRTLNPDSFSEAI